MSSLTKVKNFGSFDPEITKKVFPVEKVFIYSNGVMRVQRGSKLQGECIAPEGRKGRKIKMLTDKSLALLTATVQATEVRLSTMITLTFPAIYPRNGKDVKIALNKVLTNLRNHGSFDYVWFLEFQQRGAPHIHLLTSHNGISPHMRINLAHWWIGHIKDADWFVDEAIMQSIKCGDCEYKKMARHVRNAFSVACHPDTWEWIREPDGAKRYVTAYATKPDQKEVPKDYQDVGRFWGCSRQVSLTAKKVVATSEDDLQNFLEQQDHPAAKFDMLPKYIWNVQNV